MLKEPSTTRKSTAAGQGSITAPGCISAAPIEAPLDVESGASALDMPLVYFYGHASASDNPELYKVRATAAWGAVPGAVLGSRCLHAACASHLPK